MATVREFLLKHHQKDEGTYKVKIRVTYNRRTAYINTDHRQGTGGLLYQKGGEADRLFGRYLCPFWRARLKKSLLHIAHFVLPSKQTKESYTKCAMKQAR